MFVDSLVELSSKVVAKCLVEDRYKHLDLSLEASLNDQIVRQVTRGRREFPASLIAKESGLKLNVTHFYSFPNSRKGLMDFQLHDIQSVYLTLYNFLEVKEFRTGNGGYLDIVDYLRTILNEKSRQNLRELTIEGYGNFEGNWVEKMAELLPNLQSLDSEFSTSIYVKKVCKSFHNLIHLNIRSKPNLKYIHCLKNLQTLSITDSVFKSSAGLKGLFDLPNLRVLDACESQGFFSNLLLCDGSFQNLKIIECDMSDITKQQLRTLVARNPSLEVVSVIGTPCELVDFSDLPFTVLNLKTFKSCMNSLKNTIKRKEFNMEQLKKPINRMAELLEKKRVGDGLKEDEFLKLMMEVTRKFPYFRNGTNQVTQCLIPYFKRIFPGQSMTEILQNLDPKSPLFSERRWAAQTVLRYFPEPVVCF